MPTDRSKQAMDPSPNYPSFRPGLPMLLSFLVPGLGQFYDGRRFAGCLWLLATLVGYIPFILPGLVIHLLAVITAGFRYDSESS